MSTSTELSNLVISIKATIDSYKVIKKLDYISNEGEMNEIRGIIHKNNMGIYSLDTIEEAFMTILNQDLDKTSKQKLGYPYLGELLDDNNSLIQLVWFLSPKTGIMLINVDEAGTHQFGQYHIKFREENYKPSNLVFLLANDGVRIPEVVQNFITGQYSSI